MRHLLGFTFALTALALHTVSGAEAAWTQFGGPMQGFEFQTSIPISAKPPTKRWQQTLGEGMASVVVKDNIAYTSYLVPFDADEKKQPESDRNHREAVVALDAENGQLIWRHEYEAGWNDSQQAFGGRSRAPQATPAICGDHLLCIGFTGIMHCLDRMTGKVVWKKSLVDAFDSVPVQFGFSASPLPFGDSVIVLAGGRGGGLVCLDAKTGEMNWNVACNEASYATPVLWNRPDGQQLVFATRNRVVGVDAKNGKELWAYQHPEEGLTNVPTPMPVDHVGILVSGQGIKGTRRLNIVRDLTEYKVSEAWRSAKQFFYCNWVRRDGVLWGCVGNLLVAVDIETGKPVGQFRGYNDANLLLTDNQMLIFHGDGHLSKLQMFAGELKVIAKFSVFDQRCWTPPTPSGNYLYCRGGDQLICLDLVGGDPRAAVVPARVRKSVLAFGATANAVEKMEPLQSILAVFEKDGANSARSVYNGLRHQDPDAIQFEQRSQLARMANDEGHYDFAKLILQHAAEDFPEETKQANQTPSSDTNRGENGLMYLEFGIRNTTKQTIQAYVKGPEKHSFSYGLPLSPGPARIERWPVGTKLYRMDQGIRKDVLLTVRMGFAGTTVNVPDAAAIKE